MKLKIFNQLGKEIGSQEVDFNLKTKFDVKQYIVSSLANRRQATAHAKTRGEVSYSTRKPWRQKGTGRARAGSAGSPLWVGGGATFPPRKNRNFKTKINRKVRKLARKLLMLDKIKNQRALILQGAKFSRPSASRVAQMLKKMDIYGKKTLIITFNRLEKFYLSCRNIKNLTYKHLAEVSALDIALNQQVIISQKALDQLFEKKQ